MVSWARDPYRGILHHVGASNGCKYSLHEAFSYAMVKRLNSEFVLFLKMPSERIPRPDVVGTAGRFNGLKDYQEATQR